MNPVASSIPPLAETSDWRAAASPGERHAAAVTWVRRGQRETGCEHVVILTAAGDLVHAGTSGISHRVGIPRGHGHRDVVIHHSHPAEVSLSPADFYAAWRHSPGSEVRAYTPNGATFAGRARVDPLLWRHGRALAAAVLASELRVLGRQDRRSYVSLAFHIANAEMEALGLVWYHAHFTADARDDLTRLQNRLPALRAAARQEFERDVRT